MENIDAHGKLPKTTGHAKLIDVAYGTPLFIVDAFVVVGLGSLIRAQAASFATSGDALTALLMVQEFATIAFAFLQASLFFIRRLPLRKAEGAAPRAVALISSNLGFAFLLLPRVPQSPTTLVASTVIIILGLSASIYCAAVLGRAFSILPQAREFVSKGPYRLVRHPLYFAEQVTTFGLCCQFEQPWSLLLAFVSLGLQIVRMRYEEQVLTAAFPAYQDYAARTARLVPGIY